MAGLRLSLAGRRVQECPLPSPAPTSSAFPGQSLLRLGWYAEDGGGAPTLWNKDNGPLSGVTESLFVGVEHPPKPSQLASRCQACCGRESGSTCSLEGHQVRWVTPGSGSDLYSGRLSFYCWSCLVPSYKDSLQTYPQTSAEPGTGLDTQGLAGPGGQLLGMHFGSAMSTSLLGPHRHSKWNQMRLCKMELGRTRVMTATKSDHSSSIPQDPQGGRSEMTPAICSLISACMCI